MSNNQDPLFVTPPFFVLPSLDGPQRGVLRVLLTTPSSLNAGSPVRARRCASDKDSADYHKIAPNPGLTSAACGCRCGASAPCRRRTCGCRCASSPGRDLIWITRIYPAYREHHRAGAEAAADSFFALRAQSETAAISLSLSSPFLRLPLRRRRLRLRLARATAPPSGPAGCSKTDGACVAPGGPSQSPGGAPRAAAGGGPGGGGPGWGPIYIYIYIYIHTYIHSV